jgi:hypothetical protein
VDTTIWSTPRWAISARRAACVIFASRFASASWSEAAFDFLLGSQQVPDV